MSTFSLITRKTLRGAVAAVAIFGFVAGAPVAAYAQECADDSGPSKTLNPRVAQALGTVFEQMQADQYQEALAALNQLLAQRSGSMSDFDKATTYELRGSVKANLEDFGGALQDFQIALNTGALPTSRNNQLRYFIAQLNFQEERYQTAIGGLNQWISFAQRCGETVDPNAYYLLAAAYTQVSPANYRAALNPGESAVRANEAAVRDPAQSVEPRKGYYDLLNLIYSELNQSDKRAGLLEKMVNLWPGQKSYWTQLSGLYSTTNRDRDAFAVLEVAYRAGLLDREEELKTLVQYYSFFDNPYRGAKMLAREMDAGNIKRTQENLVTLSQLWSQSREHKSSIPILREAAGRSSKGELSYRLGMVLLADEQYGAAERALETALNKGGMKAKDTADARMLLGTARFSQAGPEDTEIWADARKAFVNAQRYDSTRRAAGQWISYIDAVASTYEQQIALEEQQKADRCRADLQRSIQQQRIVELRGQQASPEEEQAWAEVSERCAQYADG